MFPFPRTSMGVCGRSRRGNLYKESGEDGERGDSFLAPSLFSLLSLFK